MTFYCRYILTPSNITMKNTFVSYLLKRKENCIVNKSIKNSFAPYKTVLLKTKNYELYFV